MKVIVRLILRSTWIRLSSVVCFTSVAVADNSAKGRLLSASRACTALERQTSPVHAPISIKAINLAHALSVTKVNSRLKSITMFYGTRVNSSGVDTLFVPARQIRRLAQGNPPLAGSERASGCGAHSRRGGGGGRGGVALAAAAVGGYSQLGLFVIWVGQFLMTVKTL